MAILLLMTSPLPDVTTSTSQTASIWAMFQKWPTIFRTISRTNVKRNYQIQWLVISIVKIFAVGEVKMFSSGIHAPLGTELVEYELVQASHRPMRESLVQFGRGETFTSNTGPNEAHSPDNYIYLESSNADKAKIFSPKIPKHTEICLKFYYHMHGIGWLL